MKEDIKIGGIWKVNNKEYSGEMVVNKNTGFVGLIIYFEDREKPLGTAIDFDKVNEIIGTTIQGNKVILVENEVIRNNNRNLYYNTVIFKSEYAVMGNNFRKKEEVLFNRIDIKVSNMISWSGLGGIIPLRLKEYDTAIAYKFKEKIEYIIDDNYSLEFVPIRGKFSEQYNTKEVSIRQDVAIRISSKTMRPLEDFYYILKRVLDLIKVGTGEEIDIQEIKAYKDDYFYMDGDIKRLLEMYIYSNKIKVCEDKRQITNREYIFTLQDLINDRNSIVKWFRCYDRFEPIIDLYLLAISKNDLPNHIRFLNIIQAIESYHSRFVTNSKEELFSKLEKLTENTKAEQTDILEKMREFNLSSKKIILKNRIIHLLLDAMYNGTIFFKGGKENPIDIADKIVKTRNYYTHYDETIKVDSIKDKELDIAVNYLYIIMSYYILVELKLDEDYIIKKINEKMSFIRQENLIERMLDS